MSSSRRVKGCVIQSRLLYIPVTLISVTIYLNYMREAKELLRLFVFEQNQFEVQDTLVSFRVFLNQNIF